MMGKAGTTCFARTLAARAAAALRDRRGAAAVEFAFLVPILLGLYFVTMEVSQAVEANKKVGRIASMVGDLITQQQEIDQAGIDAIMKIGGSIIQPYNRSVASIYVTAIEISEDSPPQPRVAWSRKSVNGATSAYLAPASPASVPAALALPNSFLIKVEATLDYQPILTWSAEAKQSIGLAAAFDNIAMSEEYFLRPRMSAKVKCLDC